MPILPLPAGKILFDTFHLRTAPIIHLFDSSRRGPFLTKLPKEQFYRWRMEPVLLGLLVPLSSRTPGDRKRAIWKLCLTWNHWSLRRLADYIAYRAWCETPGQVPLVKSVTWSAITGRPRVRYTAAFDWLRVLKFGIEQTDSQTRRIVILPEAVAPNGVLVTL